MQGMLTGGCDDLSDNTWLPLCMLATLSCSQSRSNMRQLKYSAYGQLAVARALHLDTLANCARLTVPH